MDLFLKICMFQNRGNGNTLLTVSSLGDDSPCFFEDDSYSYYGTFYSINPTFRPVLPNTNLFCLSESSGLKMIYDMYNTDSFRDGIWFVAWVSPTPNTTPLYILNNKRTLSFTKPDSLTKDEAVTPQIYVLTEKNVRNNQIFFKGSNGRCMPLSKNDSGNTITQCVTKNILELTHKKQGEDVSILTAFQLNTDYSVLKFVLIFVLTFVFLEGIKKTFSITK